MCPSPRKAPWEAATDTPSLCGAGNWSTQRHGPGGAGVGDGQRIGVPLADLHAGRRAVQGEGRSISCGDRKDFPRPCVRPRSSANRRRLVAGLLMVKWPVHIGVHEQRGGVRA